MRRPIVLIGLGLALGFSTSVWAVDITECGQVVPSRDVGNLVGDLDCTDPNGFFDPPLSAIELGRGATLNLNGFSLSGPTTTEGLERRGVLCRSRCRVNGPGTITGFDWGIHGDRKKSRVTVTDVTINGANVAGAQAFPLVVRRCTITGSGRSGVEGGTAKVRVSDSEISGNVFNGIWARRIILKNVIVTENGEHGVLSDDGRVLAKDSVIIGNGLDCTPTACRDLAGSSKMRLVRTIFGTCVAPGGCFVRN